MLDLFCSGVFPILITRNNSKIKTRKNWNEYMRKYWVKYRFVEPHHTEKSPFEQDMASWKSKITKVMIDYNIDQKVWFKLIQRTDYIHNYQEKKGINIAPLH